jgi:hypothetical protein
MTDVSKERSPHGNVAHCAPPIVIEANRRFDIVNKINRLIPYFIELSMVDCHKGPSVPEATPLRFGEILAASTMMPELASLPLECWPEYRYSAVSNNRARSKALGFSGRSLTYALLRFVKIAVANSIAAVATVRGNVTLRSK